MKKLKTLRCQVCGIEVEIKINRVENLRSHNRKINKTYEIHEQQRGVLSNVCVNQKLQSNSLQYHIEDEKTHFQTIDGILISLIEFESITDNRSAEFEDDISLMMKRAEIDGFNEANRVIQAISTTPLHTDQPIKHFLVEKEECVWECQFCGHICRAQRGPDYCPTCERTDNAFKQCFLLN
jgi:rubrerythrin